MSNDVPFLENESTTISNISSSSTSSEISADSSSMVSGDTSKIPDESSLPYPSSSLNNLLSGLPNSSSSSTMGEAPLASVPGSSANTAVPVHSEKDEKILITIR